MRKFIITGNLTRDPKRSPSGKALYLNIAASNSNKDSTQFINLVAFAKTAEVLEEHARKGQRLDVEGDIEYNQVGDDDYRTSLVIRTFEFSGGKPKGETTPDEPHEPAEPAPGEEPF